MATTDKGIGPLVGALTGQGLLRTQTTMHPARPGANPQRQRLLVVIVFGSYLVVWLAVGIPVGVASGYFLIGLLAGFGATMVFGIVASVVAVLVDSRRTGRGTGAPS